MSDSISGYGGLTGSNQVLTLTTDGGGDILYSFDMYTIPDDFIVAYSGTVLIDSGFVSNSRSGEIAIPNGTSNQVDVIILSYGLNTLWSYTVTGQTQFPTTPLLVSIIGPGSWGAPDVNGNVSATGSFDVSYGGGPTLLAVNNTTATIENGVVAFAPGAVTYALNGTATTELFTGGFTVNDTTGLVSGITPAAVGFFGGSTLTVSGAQLQQTEIGLAYSLSLGGWLHPVSVSSTSSSGATSLFLTAQGLQFGQLGSLAGISALGVNFFNDFTASLSNLTIDSDSTGDILITSGSLATVAPFGPGATIGLTLNGANSVLEDSVGGSISLAGSLSATAEWAIAPGFELDDVSIEFGASVSGQATLKLPFGTSGGNISLPASIGFSVNPWLINSIVVNDTIAAGLDIPGTPFVLTGAVGTVANLSAFSGTLDLAVGTPGGTFDLLQLAAIGSLTNAETETASLTGGLGVSLTSGTTLATVAGYGTFDWTLGTLAASLQTSVASGLFGGTVALAGNSYGFELSGTGTATLPTVATINGVDLTLPALIGGGSTISYATLQGSYTAGGSLSGDYLAIGWTQTIGLDDFAGNQSSAAESVGIQIPFAGAPTLVGVGAVYNLGTPTALGTIADSATYEILAGTSLLVMTAEWTNTTGTAALSVIEPNGAVVPEANFSTSGIYDVPGLDGPGVQAVAILNPQGSNWQLEVDNTDTVGAVTFSATEFTGPSGFSSNPPPANLPTNLAVALTGPTSVLAYATGDLTLTLAITNSGTATATNVAVDVTIPVGFTPDSSQTTLVQAGPGWQVPVGAIGAGQTVTDQLLLTPTGSTTGGLSTFDAVVFSEAPNTLAGAAGAASLAVATLPAVVSGFDLVASHIGIGQTAAGGGDFTYTLDLSNIGNAAASNYSLTETDGGGQIVSATVLAASADGSASTSFDSLNNVLTLSGNTLPGGSSDLVAVTVQPYGAAPVVGTAVVQSATGTALTPADATQVDVLGSGSTQLFQPADLTTSITSSAPVAMGGTVTLTVSVSNSGPNLASSVVIEVELPSVISEVSATTVQGSFDPTTGLWNVGNVANGSTRTLTIEATAVSAGTQTATVSVASLANSDTNAGNNNSTAAVTVACFATGTRILTPSGAVAVEDLRPGMSVLNEAGAAMAIRWIGSRRTDCGQHPRPADVRPVRIRNGAFAKNKPLRDLVLSPDHSIYIDKVLIPIRHLINGVSVVQEAIREITYWHVELVRHDIILAEGLACESYLDTGNRNSFGDGAVVDLHPDFAHYVWEAEGCAPLIVCGPKLAAVRRRLAARAGRFTAAEGMTRRDITKGDITKGGMTKGGMTMRKAGPHAA
jgi:uncharacterized repeat protein (TIGR01451 family)